MGGMVGESLRLAQGGTLNRPPPYVGGALGGERALQRLPHSSLYVRGEMNLPPCMEGDHISPYTLITLFIYNKKIIWDP